jgi:hypothetical protein
MHVMSGTVCCVRARMSWRYTAQLQLISCLRCPLSTSLRYNKSCDFRLHVADRRPSCMSSCHHVGCSASKHCCALSIDTDHINNSIGSAMEKCIMIASLLRLGYHYRFLCCHPSPRYPGMFSPLLIQSRPQTQINHVLPV